MCRRRFFLLGSAYYEMGSSTKAIRVSGGGASRSGLRGGASPARSGLSRPRLERDERSSPSVERSSSIPRRCATATWCAFSRARPPRRCLRWMAKRRICLAKPSGSSRARCRNALWPCIATRSNPTRAMPTLLLSYALACLRLDRSQEAQAAIRRLLELEPDEMLRATAYATMIEALRNEGRYKEGNGFGRRLLEEGESAFAKSIAYYEMAYNLAEMEEDLDQALDYARMSLEHSPDELRQFPLAALGWVLLQAERVRSRRRLPGAVDRAGPIGDDADASGNGSAGYRRGRGRTPCARRGAPSRSAGRHGRAEADGVPQGQHAPP